MSGSPRYPAARNYVSAEQEQLSLQLKALTRTLDEAAHLHIDKVHEQIKQQKYAQEEFNDKVAALRSELSQYEQLEDATSVQRTVTTTQEGAQSVWVNMTADIKKEHKSELAKLDQEIDARRNEQRTEISALDAELLKLNEELDEIQESFEAEDGNLVARIAGHKRHHEKLEVTISTRQKESKEKVKAETSERIRAVRQVYWDHFRSMKEEHQRAHHMTLTLETRYKELSQQFIQLLHENSSALWTEKVLDEGHNALQTDINLNGFGSALCSKQNSRLMKQRLDAEVERVCAYQQHQVQAHTNGSRSFNVEESRKGSQEGSFEFTESMDRW